MDERVVGATVGKKTVLMPVLRGAVILIVQIRILNRAVVCAVNGVFSAIDIGANDGDRRAFKNALIRRTAVDGGVLYGDGSGGRIGHDGAVDETVFDHDVTRIDDQTAVHLF